MTITFDFDSYDVTLDESAGLQTTNVVGTDPDEDNNDDDILLATLQAQAADFYDRLYNDLLLTNEIGVATGQIAAVTSDTLPITDISFDFTDGDWSGLYDLDGNKLFYYADTDEDTVFLRRGDGDTAQSDGDIIIAIYLDEDSDGTSLTEDVDVWIVQFEAIYNPDAADDDDAVSLSNLDLKVSSSIEFEFSGAPAGQNYFMAFGTTSAALLVTGLDPIDDTDAENLTSGDTVNSSQGGGPTTLGSNNQMINSGEGLIFTFVSGFDGDYLVPNLDQNEADEEGLIQYSGFVTSLGATITISQTQPASSTSDITLTAFVDNDLTADTDYTDGLGDDVQVDILSVQVMRDGGDVSADPSISITINNGIATITGIEAGDQLVYTTVGDSTGVKVEHAGGANFDVGGFAILQAAESTMEIDNINFEDDGPVADIVAAAGSVTVDETAGIQDDDTVAAPVAALFAGVAFAGTDGGLPQYATNATALVDVSGSSAGADEEGATTVISLAIVGGDNTDSGLSTTGSLLNILLVKEGNLIIGRIDSDNDDVVDDANPNDLAAFAIAINQDGTVAIALYMSLDHLIFPADFDDSLDLTGLVNAVVTVTDGDGDIDVDTFGIGDKIIFDDDGPTLADPANTIVAFVKSAGALDSEVILPLVELDGNDKVVFVFDPGADDEGASLKITDYVGKDGAGEFVGTGLDDLADLFGWNITVTSTDTTVTYWTDGTEKLFELTVNVDDPDNYTFEVFQDAPIVFNNLDFSTLESGAPVETITLTSDSDTDARFDGYLFTGPNATSITGATNPNNGEDYLNPDNLGFGVFQGQSSNINNNEGFKLETFVENTMTAKPVIGMQFTIDQQGNTDDVVLTFQLSLDGFGVGDADPTLSIHGVTGADGETLEFGTNGAGEFFVYTTLPNGNNDIIFTIIEDDLYGTYQPQSNEIVVYVDGEFDSALFKATYPDDDVDLTDGSTIDATAAPLENDSIRIKDVFLIEQGDTPDVQLAFAVEGTDGDGDVTGDQIFTVGIDGDGDGLVIV